MTKKEPKMKISIALDRELVEILDEYADVVGMPRSRILNDIVLQSSPSLRVVIDSIKALKANPTLHTFENVQEDVARSIEDLLKKIDE